MIPCGLIMNSPLKATPYRSSFSSYTITLYDFDIYFVKSDTKGNDKFPTPPLILGVCVQAKCEY
jgi:hypothetical protein